MPDAFVSALAGFVGVVVGAALTRALTDRADRLSRLRTAYVDWFLAVNQYIAGRGEHTLPEEERRSAFESALIRTRWTLRLLETDDTRVKTIDTLTADVLNWKYGLLEKEPYLTERIYVIADDIRSRFAKVDWSFLGEERL
jgi:hypothetical protein